MTPRERLDQAENCLRLIDAHDLRPDELIRYACAWTQIAAVDMSITIAESAGQRF